MDFNQALKKRIKKSYGGKRKLPSKSNLSAIQFVENELVNSECKETANLMVIENRIC